MAVFPIIITFVVCATAERLLLTLESILQCWVGQANAIVRNDLILHFNYSLVTPVLSYTFNHSYIFFAVVISSNPC